MDKFKVFYNKHPLPINLEEQLNQFANDKYNPVKIKQIINITKNCPTVLVWYEKINEEE